MKILKEFKQPIYPFNLYVAVGDDLEFTNRKFVDYYDADRLSLAWENDIAFVQQVISKKREYGVLICFRSLQYMKVGVIAHESCHATKRIFDYIGADARHHEPFEYLMEWIVRCCDEVKNPKKKKTKK